MKNYKNYNSWTASDRQMKTGWGGRTETGKQLFFLPLDVSVALYLFPTEVDSISLIHDLLCLMVAPPSPASLPTSECLFHLYIFHSHLSNLSLPLFLHPILIPGLLLLFHHFIFFFFFVFPSPSYFSLAPLVYTLNGPLILYLSPILFCPSATHECSKMNLNLRRKFSWKFTWLSSSTDWGGITDRLEESGGNRGRERRRVQRQVSCRWVFFWWQKAKLWQMWIWTQESPQKCKNGKEEPSDILSPQELSAWKRQFPPQRQE